MAAPCIFCARGRREKPQRGEGGAGGARGATKAVLPCKTGKGASLVAFHHGSRSLYLLPHSRSPGVSLSSLPKSRLPLVLAQAPHCLLSLVSERGCTDRDPWKGTGRPGLYRHVPAVAPPSALAFKKDSHAWFSLASRDGACRATAMDAVTPAQKWVRPALQYQIMHTDLITIRACHFIWEAGFYLYMSCLFPE